MGAYRSLARPLLFAFPPETAHAIAMRALSMPMPWSVIGRPDRSPLLETDLAGIRLANPVGIAAGLDKTCAHLDSLGALGFGYVTGGTITRSPRAGNPRPRIVRVDGSMVNAMGLPNPGAEAAARILARTARTAPRVVSIADEALDDVVATHALLEPHADAIELNASCPNVAWGRDRDNEEHLRAILARLTAIRRRPLFVKLPPFRTSVEREVVISLARIARDGGADALTCANTRPVDEPRLAVGRGGLSGRALAADTPRIVAAVREATDAAIPINACGGIAAVADALACIEAGATTVQVYTGFVHEGPGLVRTLTHGLAGAATRAGGPISRLIGTGSERWLSAAPPAGEDAPPGRPAMEGD